MILPAPASRENASQWIAAQALLFAGAAIVATVSAITNPGIPGLGFAIDIAMSMAILASAGGVLLFLALAPRPRPKGAFLSGVTLAATTLVYAELYRQVGASAWSVEALEYLYLFSPAAGATLLLVRAVKTRRNIGASAAALASVVAVFAVQVPLHRHLAAPAAAAVYNTPALISASIDNHADLPSLGLIPLEQALMTSELRRPTEIGRSVASISTESPPVRHAWTTGNPLPNLPHAEVLIVYDGLSTPRTTWVLPPEDMAISGRRFLLAHLLLTVWTGAGMLCAGTLPVLYAMRRQKILADPEIPLPAKLSTAYALQARMRSGRTHEDRKTEPQ